jgi:glycosyltransferase involved in cell wall biosynthesis
MADVTVIVPAYNEAPRIGTTLQELVDRYQVLVIDDGSDDSTGVAAREAGATGVSNQTSTVFVSISH